MNTVDHSSEVSNESAIEATVTEEAQGAPEAPSDNALPGATESEQSKIDAYNASEERVVELAINTLDPKDMLRKYAKLGGEALKLATKRKASLKAGSWNGKKDLEKVCSDLETLVKMRVAIKDVRMQVYIRVAIWVAAMKPIVAEVEKLSYYQVVNKFLPTLEFDAEALTGEIKPGWQVWLMETVNRQLGDEPLSMAELDASVKTRSAEIARDKEAKKDPEKALEQEKKAIEAKARAERKASQSRVSDAVDKALTAEHANATDVLDIVSKVLKDHKIEMPATGFDPATCTTNDVLHLVAKLASAGKIAEMKVMRDALDAMIKKVEAAFAAAKTKVA